MWKPKLVASYTKTTLHNVVDTLKKYTESFPGKGKHDDINDIMDHYVDNGFINLPRGDSYFFIPFRVPILAEGYRTELVSSETSLLFEYITQISDPVTFVVFDVAGKHKDSLYLLKWHQPKTNTIKEWFELSNKHNISLIIRSHKDHGLLIISNISSFIY